MSIASTAPSASVRQPPGSGGHRNTPCAPWCAAAASLQSRMHAMARPAPPGRAQQTPCHSRRARQQDSAVTHPGRLAPHGQVQGRGKAARPGRARTSTHAWLPTMGEPSVTTRTSAPGHCSAAHTPHRLARPPPRLCPVAITLAGAAPPLSSRRTCLPGRADPHVSCGPPAGARGSALRHAYERVAGLYACAGGGPGVCRPCMAPDQHHVLIKDTCESGRVGNAAGCGAGARPRSVDALPAALVTAWKLRRKPWCTRAPGYIASSTGASGAAFSLRRALRWPSGAAARLPGGAPAARPRSPQCSRGPEPGSRPGRLCKHRQPGCRRGQAPARGRSLSPARVLRRLCSSGGLRPPAAGAPLLEAGEPVVHRRRASKRKHRGAVGRQPGDGDARVIRGIHRAGARRDGAVAVLQRLRAGVSIVTVQDMCIGLQGQGLGFVV
jgi:hypothetical protein